MGFLEISLFTTQLNDRIILKIKKKISSFHGLIYTFILFCFVITMWSEG
jgi:hypothetical protein